MVKPYPVHGLCALLCTLLYIMETQGSTLLDSLTCMNNFNTHWTCQWNENREAHKLLPMSLYHWDLRGSRNREHCDLDHSNTQQDGERYMTCRINEQFISAMSTEYTFLPERSVHTEAHIIPASKVRMPSPKDVMVQKSGNGRIILKWKMPDYISSTVPLLYQITYCRKDWETWEDAVLLNVLGNTEVSFSPQLFVPGSTYLFRVRSVPDEDHLFRSPWSKESAWTIPQVDDEAVPQNLHCEYDGLTQMQCSWEVRKELITSVSYTLYYRELPTDGESKISAAISSTSTTREKSCVSRSNGIEDGVPYVQYSCTLLIPSSQANNSFHIQVRPQEEVKSFKPSDNIQTEPPTGLHIKDQLSHGYILRWRKPVVKFDTVQFIYQLCYCKQGDPVCPDELLFNVSGNLPEYYITVAELQGSTNYTARVRAKPDRKSSYNGQWSDWSQSCSWKTDKVVDTQSICISAGVISIVLSVCAFLGYKHFRRVRLRWIDSLPDPRKSKLLSKYPLEYWSLNLSPFIGRDFYAEKEETTVCFQISPMDMPESTAEEAENIAVLPTPSKPDDCPLGPYSMAPPMGGNVKHHQSTCELKDNSGTCDITEVTILQPAKEPSILGYNRLSFTRVHSMSDLEVRDSGYFTFPKSQVNLFNLPNKEAPSCQTGPAASQMGYVLSMEKQIPPRIHQMENEKRHEHGNNSYFAIPSPSDVQVSIEGPLMIINPDGTGPLLKQVGDYCFFPGLHTSQENLEGKLTPTSGQKQQQVLENQPLPAVQAFKVMQRGYLALEHT